MFRQIVWGITLLSSSFFALSEASLCCPQPFDYRWVMPTAAVVAVGGGAIAGYGAGTHVERSRVSPGAEAIFQGGLLIKRTLAWIPPSDDTPAGPLVFAEILTPYGESYHSAILGQGEPFIPAIPTLGTKENPAPRGEYRVLFTVLEEGNAPSTLGGILYQGEALLTPEQNGDGITIPLGTQASLIIDYPSGPCE